MQRQLGRMAGVALIGLAVAELGMSLLRAST